jgi:hypothetical protein
MRYITNTYLTIRGDLSRLPLVGACDGLVPTKTEAGRVVGCLRKGMGTGDSQCNGSNEEGVELHLEDVF